MISVNVKNGVLSEEEKQAYVSRAHDLYPGKAIDSIDISLDGDYADVEYHFSAVPFQRIRRITGYLVGTMDKWNDAKKAEEADRVTHSVQMPGCCSLEDMADLTSEKDTALHS